MLSGPANAGWRLAAHTLRMKKVKNPSVRSAVTTDTTGLTPRPTGPVLMRKAIPSTSAIAPPTLRNPCVGALMSAMNSKSASSINRPPAMFTGRFASDTTASTAAMPPTTPGRIRPGLDSSVMIP